MKALFTISRLLLDADRRAMARGAALSMLVLIMGAALLGLSGWFITATGLAGLAGIGIGFDVFRPSAGVRFLALGRAAARYGERLLTHDATLRALAALRVVLLRSYAREDARTLVQVRSETALTRILSDVDALDGIVLRLLLPVVAALGTFIIAFMLLGWLVGWSVPMVIFGLFLPIATFILIRLARAGIQPATRIEETAQHLRRSMIDTIRDRAALILCAQLSEREQYLQRLDKHIRVQACALDRAERNAGASLGVLTALVTTAALLVGAWMLQNQTVDPARAVIGVFVALSLVEALLPLRRGITEFGRMSFAAGRVSDRLFKTDVPGHDRVGTDAVLLCISKPGFTLQLAPRQAVALIGPSGGGKSTLLMQIAGISASSGILIKGCPPCDWSNDKLRHLMAVLPQRSVLMAGSIRENLLLGTTASDAALWEVLETVALAGDIRARGGLDLTLGEGGEGLSGGQAKRLSLARCILKEPQILLLDEPTEGLDVTTAHAVLQGVRTALPHAAILAVMHRGHEHPIFDRKLTVTPRSQVATGNEADARQAITRWVESHAPDTEFTLTRSAIHGT